MAERQIRVCVRVRPLTEAEHLEGDEAWILEGTSRIVERYVEENRTARSFAFDRIFPASSLNDAIYEAFAREIVNDAMRGYHGAVIAYGQTATGKTHTMQGTPTSPGLIPLAIEEAFNHIAGARATGAPLSVGRSVGRSGGGVSSASVVPSARRSDPGLLSQNSAGPRSASTPCA